MQAKKSRSLEILAIRFKTQQDSDEFEKQYKAIFALPQILKQVQQAGAKQLKININSNLIANKTTGKNSSINYNIMNSQSRVPKCLYCYNVLKYALVGSKQVYNGRNMRIQCEKCKCNLIGSIWHCPREYNSAHKGGRGFDLCCPCAERCF